MAAKKKVERFHCWGQMVGLESMPPKVPAWYASSITGGLRTLRAKRLFTAADDYGSITVWRGRDGLYRTRFCQWLRDVDNGTFTTLAEVRGWLRIWWPKMSDPSPARGKKGKVRR